MSHPRRIKQIPPNAELYCPKYLEFDRKAREESKTRFREHVTGRGQQLKQCIDAAITEIRSTVLALEFGPLPQYNDDDKIINDAINTMYKFIDKWDGVQFSKVFITEFNKSGKTMDWTKFSTVAKNHQDQTSWKICGQFFARYIAQARQFIHQYCQCIMNISMEQRHEITRLGCIAYAVSLLEATIRFHRTKAKPLIRFKTLVKSTKIHNELELLYKELTVKKFISAAKKRRKAKDGKTTIKSNEFHKQLLNCCKTLYRVQRQRVYDMFNIVLNNNTNNINGDEYKDDETDAESVYPSDLLSEPDADTISTNTDNNNSGGYIEYESTSLFSQHSTRQNHNTSSSNPSSTRSRSQSPREFQRTNPRDYSIRNDMRQSLRNRDKRDRNQNREAYINQVRNRNIRYNNYGNLNNTYSQNMINNHHYNSSQIMLPSMSVNREFVNNPQQQPGSGTIPASGSLMTFIDTNNDIVREGYCHSCGQVYINCRCNNNHSMSIMDDTISNSNSNSQSQSSPDYARQCEILYRENEELRRQRDECRRLLQQMQVMQTQHQQQYIQYPSNTNLYQTQAQYIIPPQNDIACFNALPPQLRLFQPSMLIRGSSLNDDNTISNNNNDIDIGMNALNLVNHGNNDRMSSSPPFIDNNNRNNNNGVDIIIDGDDIPSIPNN